MVRPLRSEFIRVSLELLNTPYIWGGKDPEIGLDCSGLVTHVLWRLGGPDWRFTYNSARLYDELRTTEAPLPGDLCFYGGGNGHISHVMVWLGVCGMVYGAAGGNSDVKTQADAWSRNAKVKLKTSHLYRPDFKGWKRTPLADEPTKEK